PVAEGDPPANRLGPRPDRAPRAARRRFAARHRGHGGAADGSRRDHSAGALQVPGRAGDRRTGRSWAPRVDWDATDFPAQVRAPRNPPSGGPFPGAAAAARRRRRSFVMRPRALLVVVSALVLAGGTAARPVQLVEAGGAEFQ